MPSFAAELRDLPEAVRSVLSSFLGSLEGAFGADLKSVVLYGSGAEGRLRPTSDVNLLLVTSNFDPAKANAIRAQFAAAHAAVQLKAMFLLESEIAPASELFGQKFSDIQRRHRVLYGSDPFAGLEIPRAAVVGRLRQTLLNLTLRLREAYVERGTTPERLAALIADFAGPLRASAATLRELEGKPRLAPKEAFETFVAELGDQRTASVPQRLTEVRQRELLSAEEADETLFQMIEIASRLRSRADALR